ncbi:hypothetical protein EKG83_02925 [Saccharothrix syringae]|uniref:Winged helix-turn helix domain-containing protein n=1 Tax=Saccharothrix syringae TaxID=103733 RepID=A0A5Q0HCT4_SACSY|nr:hypothetical protein EKG83_02925 [Saccharothrix syringae]
MVVARRFPVRFSPAQTWRIPRQVGFTPRLPAHRSAERDEHRAATWTRTTRPRAGKERPPGTRGRASPANPGSCAHRRPAPGLGAGHRCCGCAPPARRACPWPACPAANPATAPG